MHARSLSASSIFLYVKREGRSTPTSLLHMYVACCPVSWELPPLQAKPWHRSRGIPPEGHRDRFPTGCRYSATPLSHCRRRESLWVTFSNKSSPQSWPTLLPLIWTVSPLCPPPHSIPVRSPELLLHDAQASTVLTGFPGGSDGKESACRCRRAGFDPWVGKIPWRQS